ncbi:hypothetical protein CCR75_005291 [Bremia lactucae]|uniref:Myb-like DNA-binding protein n=1 Tax=Bremia lactucae TaxID=4779 RepID=A0A976IFR6_BRELC|nr:hypothetical protein CCR75_005291 [Bremia lactucae]
MASWISSASVPSGATSGREMSFTSMVESAAAANEWAQDIKVAPEGRGVWSPDEHRLFVEGIKIFPSGPWKDIASHVGTRTARQTMTHAQKYRQKIARRLRNLRKDGNHRLPFLMNQSSRFDALLSSEELFNDSILATSMAIAAEEELDLLDETSEGSASPSMANNANSYQKHLPLAIDFSSTEANPYHLDGPPFEPSDIEFDKCIDFLIETFHRET